MNGTVRTLKNRKEERVDQSFSDVFWPFNRSSTVFRFSLSEVKKFSASLLKVQLSVTLYAGKRATRQWIFNLKIIPLDNKELNIYVCSMRVCEQALVWVSVRNERKREHVWVSEWESKWESEWVSEIMHEWVRAYMSEYEQVFVRGLHTLHFILFTSTWKYDKIISRVKCTQNDLQQFAQGFC